MCFFFSICDIKTESLVVFRKLSRYFTWHFYVTWQHYISDIAFHRVSLCLNGVLSSVRIWSNTLKQVLTRNSLYIPVPRTGSVIQMLLLNTVYHICLSLLFGIKKGCCFSGLICFHVVIFEPFIDYTYVNLFLVDSCYVDSHTTSTHFYISSSLLSIKL